MLFYIHAYGIFTTFYNSMYVGYFEFSGIVVTHRFQDDTKLEAPLLLKIGGESQSWRSHTFCLHNYCWNEWTPFWMGNNAKIKRVSSHVLLLKFLNMFLQYLYNCVCGKSLEWNAPVWFANLELTTAVAFDRVEYFRALLDRGVPTSYCSLPWTLHQHQQGTLRHGPSFSIQRGVKQGDVISPVLSNAALQTAVRNWKLHLSHHGVDIGAGEKFTNIRQLRWWFAGVRSSCGRLTLHWK